MLVLFLNKPSISIKACHVGDKGDNPKDRFRGKPSENSIHNREAQLQQVLIWALFSFAVSAATIRTAVRIRSKGRLFLDDAFLIFACLTLVAATVILQIELGTIYLAEELTELYKSGKFPDHVDINTIVARYHIAQYGHGTMGWLTIFAVKFSFLSFFRHLVTKIPRLESYWRFVLAFNFVAFLYCMLYLAAECPHNGSASRTFCLSCVALDFTKTPYQSNVWAV